MAVDETTKSSSSQIAQTYDRIFNTMVKIEIKRFGDDNDQNNFRIFGAKNAAAIKFNILLIHILVKHMYCQ